MALREAGRIAYQEGKSRDACCHLGILDQLQWDMGWELARLEDESNKESQ
jgi:ribosome modulation factor